MPKPNSGTFSYPGGKTTISPWIVDHFADHDIYVEPFGGSASTFMYKQPSPTEVYNDLNDHCVTFFQVIKERADDLAEWIRATPYSRELFERWVGEFKAGETPDDPVEHAGRFWFVQTASFGGKLPKEGAHFRVAIQPVSRGDRPVCTWQNKENTVAVLQSRFREVQIESQDYRKVIDRYDTGDTLFYLDPPYVGVGDEYYAGEDFDHAALGETLADVTGRWILSYDELPEWCHEYYVISRQREWTLDADRESSGTEKLVMNYDPNTVPKFSEHEQATVDSF